MQSDSASIFLFQHEWVFLYKYGNESMRKLDKMNKRIIKITRMFVQFVK